MRIMVGGLHCTYPYQSPPLSCSQYLSHMHITSVIPFGSAKTISSPATDRSPSFAKQNFNEYYCPAAQHRAVPIRLFSLSCESRPVNLLTDLLSFQQHFDHPLSTNLCGP